VFKGQSREKLEVESVKKMEFTGPIGIGIERTKTQKP
jgi:hypothetical protein